MFRYAARFDCASQYDLKVFLYNENKDIIDQFEFSWVEEQWRGKEWHLVSGFVLDFTSLHKKYLSTVELQFRCL